jgi:glycosyltransferase involved in cell wall biosynthesis
MKVLINAYACNPYRGSEEGVGWNWVKMISSFADAWVLVAGYHREDIDGYLKQHPDELHNVHFIYVPHKFWHYHPSPRWKRIEASVFKPAMNIAYALWLHDAYVLAKQFHEKQVFDLAHQITYVGFRFPGRLWKLDIPFIWGPVGGLENTPWRLLSVFGLQGAVYYAGRNLINSLQKLTLRSSRKAFRSARVVIAATSGIQKEIKHWYGVESRVICEVGPPDHDIETVSLHEPGEPLRMVWSGEHLPGKALPLLLEALAMLPDELDWHLDILGEGPATIAWQVLADEWQVNSHCQWHGRVPRDKALAVMEVGHVFVITSLKDLTSTVLLEALSLGMPVVCPDHCGFADVVDDSCGIKLAVESAAGLIKGYENAIRMLSTDEHQRQVLAHGALERARQYAWEQKRKELEIIYQQLF